MYITKLMDRISKDLNNLMIDSTKNYNIYMKPEFVNQYRLNIIKLSHDFQVGEYDLFFYGIKIYPDENITNDYIIKRI